ncbi:MAG: hypothetical protein NC043_07065 [Muribaculaceae bacterium]|nr:hypothetical protein [Muribaculaceae bacterium]
MGLTYDMDNLERLYKELEPRRRRQALRGGFRKAGRNFRAKVIANLRSDISSNRELEKGVRVLTFKRTAGFRVAVSSRKGGKGGRGEAGMYLSRQQRRKGQRKLPVLMWAEDGTASRYTRGRGFFRRGRRYTGRMPRMGFLSRTVRESGAGVSADIREMVIENVQRIAKKYGCK